MLPGKNISRLILTVYIHYQKGGREGNEWFPRKIENHVLLYLHIDFPPIRGRNMIPGGKGFKINDYY